MDFLHQPTAALVGRHLKKQPTKRMPYPECSKGILQYIGAEILTCAEPQARYRWRCMPICVLHKLPGWAQYIHDSLRNASELTVKLLSCHTPGQTLWCFLVDKHA